MPDTNPPLIPLSELKAHVSDLMARVEAGSEFVITRHGKPVGRLVPIKPPKRKGGDLKGPFWEGLTEAKIMEIFAPMTDEELRAEGWED